MKYVREYLNEKFSEDSDPIEDLNIGISRYKKKYESSLLTTVLNAINERELRQIENVFELSREKLYFLGEYPGLIENKIIKKIEKLLENGRKIFETEIDLSDNLNDNIFSVYETKYGKIGTFMYHKQSGHPKPTQYISNLAVLVMLYEHKSI